MLPKDKNTDEIDIDDLPSLSEIISDSTAQKVDPPKSVVLRLPRYYRFLRDLMNNDVMRISSSELADMMGMTASQIRHDLNCFGEFGQQGYGYDVKNLFMQIGRILGMRGRFSAAVVGVSDFCELIKFMVPGIRIKKFFDTASEEYSVCSLGDFCRRESIDILVMYVPRDAVADIVDEMESAGVKGIWNFSSTEVRSDKMAVQNICPADSLLLLTYALTDKEKKK